MKSEPKVDWAMVGCIAFLGVCCLLTAMMAAAPLLYEFAHRGHPGHYEVVRVEGEVVPQSIVMSNGNGGISSGVTTQFVPEHDERRWVCDKCK